jgi:hypothetical protein
MFENTASCTEDDSFDAFIVNINFLYHIVLLT